MAKTGSSGPRLALDDEWVAAALDGLEDGASSARILTEVHGRRICLNVTAGGGSDEAWARYSEVAARRAELTGERLCPLLASGRSAEFFFSAYDVLSAEPLYENGELTQLSSAQCVGLLHGIGRGLEEAAAEGFYPAELSPDSVLVQPGRGALLVDMGLAREALGNPPEASDRLAPWVAPEVLKGEKPTERSAVYSFGALLYTLLSGASPHARTGRKVAAAEPPSLRELRPDVPEPLAFVVATAMARDPKRRYRTASEARSLATILLQGELRPAAPQQPQPRRAAALGRRRPAAVARPKRRVAGAKAPARRSRRPAPRSRPEASRKPAGAAQGRPLTLPMAASVLAVGALAGFVLAGGGPTEPAPPESFAQGDVRLQLPGDWEASAPSAGTLKAHPASDPGSGLTLESLDSPVEPGEQGEPVRLVGLEAWREPGAEGAIAGSAVRYVVPTESGKLVATCRASPHSAPGTLTTCERVASTLELRSAKGLSLAAVVEAQKRRQAEVTRLARERIGARRRLAAAELPAGQRVAADALGRVHDRAAGRFGALPGGDAVAQAARRTAAAYRALARAAAGESRARWDGARGRVRRSEAALRQALAGA